MGVISTSYISFQAEPVSHRTLLKKVRQIESLKETGNDSFKSGRWQEAISKYSECIDVLSQDGEGENEAIKLTLLSNRATAYQKAGMNELAIKDANGILAKDAKHFKACVVSLVSCFLPFLFKRMLICGLRMTSLRTRARAHCECD